MQNVEFWNVSNFLQLELLGEFSHSANAALWPPLEQMPTVGRAYLWDMATNGALSRKVRAVPWGAGKSRDMREHPA